MGILHKEGLSKWKLDNFQSWAQQLGHWNSPLSLELVILLCPFSIIAVNPFFIPTESFALLAGLSGEIKRLIWKITEQEVNKQTNMMRWWVIMQIPRQGASAVIITLHLSQGTIGSHSSCMPLPTLSLKSPSVSLIKTVV